MTSEVDIANRGLSALGARATISSFSEDSNEARQASLLYVPTRDQLLRMAPWNCATNYDNLALLKAAPGTPENPTAGQTVWTKAIPPPPWAYEYAYPANCLMPLWIVPQLQTGFSGGVPITTAVTGGQPYFWNGPPVSFKVAIDQDFSGSDIRVILTNQSQAILTYIKSVTDPNVWDPQFQEALVSILAARFVFALTGDKVLANMKISLANATIAQARGGDGNEGLTINDVTPDWIRARGFVGPETWAGGPSYNWDPLYSLYT